jgi:hypothetical protein
MKIAPRSKLFTLAVAAGLVPTLGLLGCGEDPAKDAGKISVSAAKSQSGQDSMEPSPTKGKKSASPQTGRSREGL